jgi:ABC-type lipoprotein export system ATPase subunit
MIKFTKMCSISRILLSDVSKTFVEGDNQLLVIENLSCTFMKGHTYALMGASGTGKSTLLHVIAGFEQPTTGIILYDDVNQALVTKKQKQQYLRYSLGILLQNAYLLDELSVFENVMLKGIYEGLSQEACQKEAALLLETVGLQDKINALPHQLSGGQQQRVALARALCGQPDFILADEPTGNLDEVTSAQVIDMLCYNQKKFGMGMIVSTHDRAVAQKMDVVLELRNGKLLQRN